MLTRSTRITLAGKDYRMRFNPADVVALEEQLEVGLFLFFDREKMGIKFARALLWRGLYLENEKGDLIHAMPMTGAGLEQSGDLLLNHLSQGGQIPEVFDLAAQALTECGWFGVPKTDEKKEDGETPKNLDRTG